MIPVFPTRLTLASLAVATLALPRPAAAQGLDVDALRELLRISARATHLGDAFQSLSLINAAPGITAAHFSVDDPSDHYGDYSLDVLKLPLRREFDAAVWGRPLFTELTLGWTRADQTLGLAINSPDVTEADVRIDTLTALAGVGISFPVWQEGRVALKMRELGKMTPEERQVAGPALNALKDEINARSPPRRPRWPTPRSTKRLRTEWLDVTCRPRPRPQGTIHPVSQVTEEVTAIFADMGFAVAEGPQIEDDWYNFDALNIPPTTPRGRNMDTFYMHRAEGDNRPPHVLRTHTSPVQIRAMQARARPSG
jgi:hypothetical protein